jgi:NAD(P)-dependent dehydrogenase (short-subunit alcohol dehydrogenase family)
MLPPSTNISLNGKTALVTGGGRGIGKAIAARLAAAGANVVIASRKADVLAQTAQELSVLPGKVHPIPCHVGRLDQLEALVRQTTETFAPIDILVNNSGTNVGQGPSLQLTDEAILKTFEVNLLAAHRLCRLTVPSMIARGGGAVINIASIAGLHPQHESLAYSTSKAALIMATRVWAVEWGRHNVRVNAICPGLVETDFSSFFWKDEAHMAELRANQPIPRTGRPEEISWTALYLASDEAQWVTGQCFTIDGGHTAR